MAYRNYSTANGFTVAKDGNGDFSTIATALTASSSGQTIFIRPGTYTENLTLKAGVNLTAFTDDGLTPNVTIVGKCTFTTAGTVSISGIRLQTNSDNFLAVTGSAASIVNLDYCYLNCSNNTGISFTSSSGSAAINITNCRGNLGTTGIGVFSSTSSGGMTFRSTVFTNTGGSSTTSTYSAGVLNMFSSQFQSPITTSGSSAGNWSYCSFDGTLSASNATPVTLGGNFTLINCSLYGGTASAASISGTATLEGCLISSTNTNAITGAGTINYSGLNFPNTSSTINTSTQNGGSIHGIISNISGTGQNPSSGFLGERISSFVASGSAVSVTTSTFTNVTSISLTAGVWDITGIIVFNGNITGTNYSANLTTTSASGGTVGDSAFSTPTSPTSLSDTNIVVPSWRQVFTTTTTVYLVAAGIYTVGALKAYGRISAVRVG